MRAKNKIWVLCLVVAPICGIFYAWVVPEEWGVLARYGLAMLLIGGPVFIVGFLMLARTGKPEDEQEQ
jgi:lipoprotein signal peptidase